MELEFEALMNIREYTRDNVAVLAYDETQKEFNFFYGYIDPLNTTLIWVITSLKLV